MLLFFAVVTVLWPWILTGNAAELLVLYSFFAAVTVVMVARNDLRGRSVPKWVLIALVVIFVLVAHVGYWSCPHASYLRLGPVSFSIAEKPCRNIQDHKMFRDSLLARALSKLGRQPNRG